MLLRLRRFILAPWTSLLLHLSTLWGLLLSITRVELDPKPQNDEQTNGSIGSGNEGTVNTQCSQEQPANFPPTAEQLEERITKFINSIDEDAVCRLASHHNRHSPCSIIRHDRGSFNVCFFVHFDGDDVTWVVRIPLEPVVHNMWEKVQSEVTTMRYIERNTTIPIPHVYAYGESADLIKGDSTMQAFILCNYIPGQSLNMRMLMDATKEQRDQFYADLIEILAQLRKLEFPAIGSLVPNPENESEPIVGGLLSIPINELQRCFPQQGGKTFTSDEQYLTYQYHILSETHRLPTEELSREQAEMELFALHSIANQIPKLMDSQGPDGPYLLAHMDLRCGNIIVTEDLRIHGIIDWEFTGTVPRSLFTPPPWITGHDLAAVARLLDNKIYTEFLEVLETKSATSQDCAKLRDEWKNLPELMYPMAEIFRQPSTLIRVYYRFIFAKFFQGDRTTVIREFFERQGIAGTLVEEVKHRVEESRLYTQYLADRGLLVEDEEAQAMQEWRAKVAQLLKT